ncbi:MAG: hypothetical protein HYT21_01435 [Candidatus Nealsonbacteria bacterium]|nr:hypothetical protein [Candidatus Nealsonbacteria bacterium]
MINSAKNYKTVIIAVVILAVVGVAAYFESGLFIRPNLTKAQAADIAIKFIDQSIDENATASLIEATDEGQVYGLHIEIEGTEYQSYITKDGKFLFPNGFNLKTEPGN